MSVDGGDDVEPADRLTARGCVVCQGLDDDVVVGPAVGPHAPNERSSLVPDKEGTGEAQGSRQQGGVLENVAAVPLSLLLSSSASSSLSCL